MILNLSVGDTPKTKSVCLSFELFLGRSVCVSSIHSSLNVYMVM